MVEKDRSIEDGRHANRNREVESSSCDRAGEIPRQDANNRERDPFHGEGASKNIRGAIESPLPQVVADDRNRTGGAAAAPIVPVRERPPQRRRDAKRLEESASHPHAVHEFGFTAGCEIEARIGVSEGAIEQLRALPNLGPQRVAPAECRRFLRLGGICGGHDDEPFRLCDWQGAKQQTVDQREDRRVRAGAKRQGQNDHGRVARVTAHGPKGVSAVLDKAFGEAPAPGLPRRLSDEYDVAEIPPCGGGGLLGLQAVGHPLVRLFGEVKPYLFVELGFPATPVPERAAGGQQSSEHQGASVDRLWSQTTQSMRRVST